MAIAAVLALVVFGRRKPEPLRLVLESGDSSGVGQGGARDIETTINRDAEIPEARFSDMGGIDDAVEQLRPVVKWLRHPSGDIGTAIPRGLLITGPSGCGKTRLAQAIAGEAACQLYKYVGSEFNLLLVGMGASRVIHIFKQARDLAKSSGKPCVILIDDIDTLATERSEGIPIEIGGASERHNTINQLIAELDDHKLNGKVFVIATSFRSAVLEPRLLRAGRLEKPIHLSLPDEAARAQIIERLMPPRTLAEDVTFAAIARYTRTFTGLELATLIKEAESIAGGTQLRLRDFVAAKELVLPLPPGDTARHIFNYTNKSVVGQERAKKRLAVTIHTHYLRLRKANDFEVSSMELHKSNLFMIGPTGTGKTMLVETIADELRVPYVIFNSTVLTEAGMLGASVEQMLYRLIAAADHHLRRAEFGIVCIDEFDKLAFAQSVRAGKPGVQQELLKLFEGTIVDVPKTGGERHGGGADVYRLNTRNILFICLGAFNGLQMVVERRLGKVTDALRHVQPEDIIEYGFIPELVGRFPVVTTMDELSVDDLVRILGHETGLLEEYRSLLQMQGWQSPSFEPMAVRRIAEEAHRRRVGARGLRAIMEEVLLPYMFEPKRRALQVDLKAIEEALRPGADSLPMKRQSSPKTVHSGLDAQINGNAMAKRVLSAISHRHYTDPDSTRYSALLIDPQLGMRARMVEALAHVWQVPHVIVSAEYLERTLNSRPEPGAWFAEPIRALLDQADGDREKASRGIVLIDDFDRTLSRSAIDRHYRRLEQELMLVLAARRPLVPDSEVASWNPLLLLGGEFRFGHERRRSPGKEQPSLDRFNSPNLMDNLRQEFNLPHELMDLLVLAVFDTAMAEQDLESAMEIALSRLSDKHAGLIDFDRISGADWDRLKKDWMARGIRDGWSPSETLGKVEGLLMRTVSEDLI